MKIVYVSNYFNHYQKALCDELQNQIDGSFLFLETEQIAAERIRLGWRALDAPYVKQSYKMTHHSTVSLIQEADVVIFGNAPSKLVRIRTKMGGLTFACYERVLKRGDNLFQRAPRQIKYGRLYRANNNSYLLSIGAFSYGDFYSMDLFPQRAYRWGYFPEFYKVDDLHDLLEQKKKNTIIWAGRMIDWKRPEHVIRLAKILRNKQCDFQITMIGSGKLLPHIRSMISRNRLTPFVVAQGACSPDRVRQLMKYSEIFLTTSNRSEGWGVVVNEAMNSACIPVLGHLVGCAPYIIQNGYNGVIVHDGDVNTMADTIMELFTQRGRLRQMQAHAYCTIAEVWNPREAAKRLLSLIDALQKRKEPYVFTDTGPCSVAENLSEEWLNNASIQSSRNEIKR